MCLIIYEISGPGSAKTQANQPVNSMSVSRYISTCALATNQREDHVAYALDLFSRFPGTVPIAPTADGSWRTHALALETDMAALQAKYEAEQISAYSVLSISHVRL